MSQITRPEWEPRFKVAVCANEKVRSIFLTRHVLRLYYRIDGLDWVKEELANQIIQFFTPWAQEGIHFAAFNNLILTGTNNFARTWSTDIKHTKEVIVCSNKKGKRKFIVSDDFILFVCACLKKRKFAVDIENYII